MSEAASRPGAAGHRFGPDLSCSECGVTWEAHQVEPRKCIDDEEVVAPSPDSEDEIELAASEPKRVGLTTAAPANIQARAVGTD